MKYFPVILSEPKANRRILRSLATLGMTITLFLAPFSAAFAQGHIRDLSLPPNQSLNLPGKVQQGTVQPLQQPMNRDENIAPDIPIEQNNLPPARQATHFIDGYCDPNFKPLVANTPGLAGMQACLEQQKQQSCAAFRQLPADARRAINDSVDCRYQAESGDTPKTPDCGSSDTARLELVKKYWGNNATAQALVFLPDDVLGTSGKCTGGNR